MTRTVAVLLGTGIVGVIIGIVLLIKIINDNGPAPPSETRPVEITAPKDTQVFASLPDVSEQHLGTLGMGPLTLDVPVDAAIILRYKEKKESFLPAAWENGKIVWQPERAERRPEPPAVVSVTVNAVPWAEVFIKLPGTYQFVKPPDKKSNVTPIRGGLRVPVGTAIKLKYEDQEKTFGYEVWKTSETISHDFLVR